MQASLLGHNPGSTMMAGASNSRLEDLFSAVLRQVKAGGVGGKRFRITSSSMIRLFLSLSG